MSSLELDSRRVHPSCLLCLYKVNLDKNEFTFTKKQCLKAEHMLSMCDASAGCLSQ